MKKKQLFGLVLCSLIAGSPSLMAQDGAGKVQTKEIDTNGTPSFITFQKTDALTNKNSSSLGLSRSQDALRTYLPMSDDDKYVQLKSKKDALGQEHIRYQQYHNGLKVAFGTYIVHGDAQSITAMNGHFIPVQGLVTTPSLSEKEALKSALTFINASKYAWEDAQEETLLKQFSGDKASSHYPKGELLICEDFESGSKTPRLAYKFDVYAMEPFSKNDIYIDALNGELLLKNPTVYEHNERGEQLEKMTEIGSVSLLVTTDAATRYSGSQAIETEAFNGGYRLKDLTRGGGVHTRNINNGNSFNFNNGTEFIDNDNNWTAAEWDNSKYDNAALDAHWASEMTYDYYKNIHGRDSYDGRGTIMLNLVHARTNWFNAQWSGTTMRYGDGRGNPLTTLDIGAHEMTHGVTQETAGLIYRNESGALNEAFSDIFAATVENFTASGKQVWLVGEEVGYIRNMQNPKDKGHPDTYRGTNWKTGPADNGGVHSNSGVLNHWFYILSEGKASTNDNGDSYDVSGITIEKAEKIAYRMLSIYLNQSSGYAAARNAGIQAAKDFYGDDSDEVIQTTNAFYAIGVGDAYDGGGNPQTCIDSFPYSESFESNLGDWAQSSGDDIDWTRDSNGTPSRGTGPSTGADGAFYLYTEASSRGQGYPGKTAILNGPCFDISSLSAPVFEFSYHMNGTSVGSLTLEGSDDDGATWTSLWEESGSQGNSWKDVSIPFSASEKVQFRFIGVTGPSWSSDISIDNLGLKDGSTIAPVSFNDGLRSIDGTDELVDQEVKMYPNPATSSVEVVLPELDHVSEVRLMSMEGAVMSEFHIDIKDNKIDMDISSLARGAYLLNIKTEKRVILKKLFKQ